MIKLHLPVVFLCRFWSQYLKFVFLKFDTVSTCYVDEQHGIIPADLIRKVSIHLIQIYIYNYYYYYYYYYYKKRRKRSIEIKLILLLKEGKVLFNDALNPFLHMVI